MYDLFNFAKAGSEFCQISHKCSKISSKDFHITPKLSKFLQILFLVICHTTHMESSIALVKVVN